LAIHIDDQATLSTNLSRSITLTILDTHARPLSIMSNAADNQDPFRIQIPLDTTRPLSSMSFQNVTGVDHHHQLIFNTHYFAFESRSQANMSIQIELRPVTSNNNSASSLGLAYLLIYRFDVAPQLNTSVSEYDGWTLVCPASEIILLAVSVALLSLPPICLGFTNEDAFTYFIEGEQVRHRRSIIIGLRQLNATEVLTSCQPPNHSSPPVTNDRFYFTHDYEIGLSLVACYYFEENERRWRSHGMKVEESFYNHTGRRHMLSLSHARTHARTHVRLGQSE
jgi:hypothetical protein